MYTFELEHEMPITFERTWLPVHQVPVTLNSVELSKIDLPKSGRVDLDLPETVIRKLDHGQLVVRVTVARCPPEVGCGHSRHTISGIRVEYA